MASISTTSFMMIDWRYQARTADYIIAAEDAEYTYDEYTGSMIPKPEPLPEPVLSDSEQEFYDQWA